MSGRRGGALDAVLAWAALIGVIPTVLKLAMAGSIRPGTAAGIFVLLAFLLVVWPPAFRAVTPLVGVYLFVQSVVGTPAMSHVLFERILTLSFMLLGFWVMFQGLRPKRRD